MSVQSVRRLEQMGKVYTVAKVGKVGNPPRGVGASRASAALAQRHAGRCASSSSVVGRPARTAPGSGLAGSGNKPRPQPPGAPWVLTYSAYTDWLAAMNRRPRARPPKHRLAQRSGRRIRPISLPEGL